MPYETNSKGMRDREREYGGRERFRVVVLGDSFMEAQNIRLEECLAQQLESRWRDLDAEVINLGVSGYGTIQEYLYLIEEGLRYEPDLVLLAFFGLNDLENNSAEFSAIHYGPRGIQSFGRPYTIGPGAIGPGNEVYPDGWAVQTYFAQRERAHAAGGTLFSASATVRTAQLALARIRTAESDQHARMPSTDPNVLFGTMLDAFTDVNGRNTRRLDQYGPLWDAAWETTLAHLNAMDDASRESGAQFVVFTVPERFQVDVAFRKEVEHEWPGMEFDVERPQRRLGEFCDSEGIPFIDLVPGFSEYSREHPDSLYLPDRYWNEQGHALAATLLAGRLSELGIVPVAK